MNKIVLLFSLYGSAFLGMEIERIEPLCNEQTVLLGVIQRKREIDLEAGIHLPGYHKPVSSHLDKLPSHVRYEITKYFKPQHSAMRALLQNISFEPNQALELYKKFAFYNAIPQLPKLVKDSARKQLKQYRKEYKENLYQLNQHVRNLMIGQDEEIEQLKSFLDTQIMPLSELESINLDTAAEGTQKIFHGKNLIKAVDSFLKITESDTSIANAAVMIHESRRNCGRNVVINAVLLAGMVAACFIITDFSIDENEFLYECESKLLKYCEWSAYGCNVSAVNKAAKQCTINMHSKQKEMRLHNIKTWSFFCVGLSVLALVQLVILCTRCIKPSYTINPHAKELIEQYKTKINMLESNSASS